MAKKPTKKPRAKTYDPKLAIDGTFDDVGVSVGHPQPRQGKPIPEKQPAKVTKSGKKT